MDSVYRRRQILEFLDKKGIISVEELSERLKVSKVTIRTDLTNLENKGLLKRTHGGAVPAESRKNEWSTDLSSPLTDDKRRIAEAASHLIGDESCIIIDGGTTTLQLTHYLKNRALTVITGNVPVLSELSNKDKIDILVLGGSLNKITMNTADITAFTYLSKIRADYLFLSASAYNRSSIYCSNLVDAEIKNAMIKSSEKVVLLASSNKFQKTSLAHITEWDDIDYFITDRIEDEFRNQLEEKGVNVIVA